jgi:hypothetical protein
LFRKVGLYFDILISVTLFSFKGCVFLFKKVRLALCIAIIGVLGLSLNQGETYAANYKYDGKNPVSTGCNHSGVVKATKKFNKKGISGTVQLMYSTKCKTAWAFVKLNKAISFKYDSVYAVIHRNNDKKHYSCDSAGGNGSIRKGQTSCYSAMVYDYKPNTSYAEAIYMSGEWPTNMGKTSSY